VTDKTGIPVTAERVRSMCARTGTAHLVADGASPVFSPVHHLFACGHFAFTVDRRSILSTMTAGAPVVIELLDHTPTMADESVRALAWIQGRLTDIVPSEVPRIVDAIATVKPSPDLLDVGHGHQLLMCTVDSAVFADASGADAVDRAALLTARPDPFWQVESAWLQHLQIHHPDNVERLRRHLPRDARRGHLKLLGLDRHGLQVRVERPEGYRDIRVPFWRPATDGETLARALRLLMGCPFNRGLHSRFG